MAIEHTPNIQAPPEGFRAEFEMVHVLTGEPVKNQAIYRAAPELLEALKQALYALENPGAVLVDAAKFSSGQAIAKAEGGA